CPRKRVSSKRLQAAAAAQPRDASTPEASPDRAPCELPPGAIMTDHSDVTNLPFEQAIEELESIVTRLEQGKAPLEDPVAVYERGEARKRRGVELLRRAEARVEKVTLHATGKPAGTEPLDVK